MATTRRRMLAAGGVLAGGLAGCVGTSRSDESPSAGPIPVERVILHRAPSCECCDRYVEYLEENGIEVSVRTVPGDGLTETKRELGVPESMRSCHTVEFGEYVIEGNVPLEAIERLFQTSGKIHGLSVPGTPRDASGGVAASEEPVVVYAFRASGDTTAFLEVE